jgi:DNA-binding response OmpR family regulator
MRIAVLDDDVAQADLLCQWLVLEGHVCHAFAEGHALKKHLSLHTFDLLVLDWHVPDILGEEVLVCRVKNSLPYLRCVLTWVAGFANSRGNDERKTEGATCFE